MNKHSISVICLVYNEEDRIKRFIESFYCYDEIILIDKGSSDQTVEIALSMGVTVVPVEYTNCSSIWQVGVEKAIGEWVFILTASDVVHPLFTSKLYELIDDTSFEETFDIIQYPCVMHVLGIESPYSAFDSSHRNGLCKKKVLRIRDQVHEELVFDSDRIYTFPFDRNIAVHHLSHESLDIYYERQLRYSKEEIKKEKTYKRCVYEILRELYRGIKKRFWKLGAKGIGLVLMMVNYRILIFLRYFEKDMGDIRQQYNCFSQTLTETAENNFRNDTYKNIMRSLSKRGDSK